MIETCSWLARATYSWATLLSAGTALLYCTTHCDNDSISEGLKRCCGWAAALGLALSGLWVIILAAELGGEWQAATDLFYYSLIASSPAADLLLWRSIALLALFIWACQGSARRWLASIAAVAASFSFTRYGHALADPAAMRSALLLVHLCVIAWWFAAVPTLIWYLRVDTNGAFKFGKLFGLQAQWVVPLGILSGLLFSGLQFYSEHWNFQSLYAQSLFVKLGLVAIILSIGAYNHTRIIQLSAAVAEKQKTAIVALLLADGLLFSTVILISAWLTGPAAAK